jgi:peptidyl-tRNA hydrolase
MSQFDYLRSQLTGNTWANKEVLPVADAVMGAIDSGREWYFALPHIKFIMETPVMSGIASLLEASGDLADTVIDTNLVFLETVHGINRAFNSKLFRDNLAGKGNIEIAKIINSTREQSIYQNAVIAYNETLNLPALSVQVAEIEAQIAAIEQQGRSATEQIEDWKNQALAKLEETKNSLLQLISTLTGNQRRNARRRASIVDAGLTAMNTGNIPRIIAANPYAIDSISRYSFSSIIRTNIQANAIVPIAVGGAATVAGAVSVLTGIAGWLLSSFFLKAVAVPAILLPALTNTVVSIVLKILGSSGAEAVRYFAASALKAGANLLPIIFAPTGMRASGWSWLMAFATPIIGAAIIIIQAMRNRLGLAEILYVFGFVEGAPENRFHISQVVMENTNRVEILEVFKREAREIYARSKRRVSQIIGVGTDAKDKYAVAYNLTDPENPVIINGSEAIETALGPVKTAKLKSGNFLWDD